MALVFACIAPHGSMAIAEWCAPEERERAAVTRRAFEELGRRSESARIDLAVVLTPHHVHVEGHMAVVTSGAMHGVLEGGADRVELRASVDRDATGRILRALAEGGFPVVGVSYGANDPAASVMPMDWATQVPLHFIGAGRETPLPIAVVAPARDLPWEAHVSAGRAIARALGTMDRRAALIASCDHGHAHDAKGPYGFSPAAKAFDERVVDIVRRGALGELLAFQPSLVSDAKADSFWQMLMLHGALGDAWRAEFLSYEAPTYFGMLCAAFTPRG